MGEFFFTTLQPISTIMKKLIAFLFITYTTVFSVRSQQKFASIADVWQYAEEHNVTIRLSKLANQKSGYARLQSYSALLPQVNATGTFNDNQALQTTLVPAIIFDKNASPTDVKAVQFGQKYVYNYGFTAQLDVLNANNWLNLKTADINNALSQDSLAANRRTVYKQIAEQYYQYLLMKEAAKLSAISERIADSVFRATDEKFQAGVASKANWDVAKINLVKVQQNAWSAAYQERIAINNLKSLLDIPATDTIEITELMTDNDDISSMDFKEDPQLPISYHQMQLSIQQYKQVKVAALPTISIQYSDAQQQNDNQFRPFQGGTTWFPARFWAVKANWNLFTSGNRTLQMMRNKVAVQEKTLQYDNLKRQSAITDDNIRLAYLKSKGLFTKAKEIMDLSFDNYKHISNKYSEGLVGITDKLTAFNDYINYQNQYLNNLSDFMVQQYQVKIRQIDFK